MPREAGPDRGHAHRAVLDTARDIAEEGSPVVGSLDLVTIHVHDYERAKRFYRDTLELAVAEQREPDEGRWVAFQCGHIRLGFHDGPIEDGSRPPGGSSGCTFTVPDVDAAVALLRKRGARITGEPEDRSWGRIAVFADPDGNEHMLFQPPLRAPPRSGGERGPPSPRDGSEDRGLHPGGPR